MYCITGFLNGFFANNIEFYLLAMYACNFTSVNSSASIEDYDLIINSFPENPCTMP